MKSIKKLETNIEISVSSPLYVNHGIFTNLAGLGVRWHSMFYEKQRNFCLKVVKSITILLVILASTTATQDVHSIQAHNITKENNSEEEMEEGIKIIKMWVK